MGERAPPDIDAQLKAESGRLVAEMDELIRRAKMLAQEHKVIVQRRRLLARRKTERGPASPQAICGLPVCLQLESRINLLVPTPAGVHDANHRKHDGYFHE